MKKDDYLQNIIMNNRKIPDRSDTIDNNRKDVPFATNKETS